LKDIKKNKKWEGLKSIGNFFLDIFFPRNCLGCGKEGKYICENCRTFLGEAPLICPVCGRGSFSGQRHIDCPSRHKLDGLVAVWEYEGLAKTVIHGIKYRKLGDAVSELVALSLETMGKDKERFVSFFSYLLSEKPLITFIPMFSKKERKRGFNQSELMARALGKITGLETVSLLKKIKETESQTKLKKEERLKNIEGAFSLKTDSLKPPKNLILVDDIWTTGATMKEGAKILKQSGAKKIWGFVLARTV